MNFRRLGKYICALSLAVVMSTTTMAATTISDVTTTHWAYASISDLETRGIMVLTSGGQFYPNQTMNYFEVADVVAKATGYVDVDIATNVSEEFKAQIKANYEKQKETLAAYAAKYSTWNGAYNQQIAYLLGRGYMTTADLDKFITKTESGEVKNIITKEQLAVYIVRMLGKEKTATTTYKTTTFKDDSSLNAANKPYVAYLGSIGLVNADAAGKVNGTMKVTKALCAKMISESLKINDTSKVGKVESTNGTTNGSTTTPSTAANYTIGKVLTKNTDEYYILLQNAAGEQRYYSFKKTTKIYDTTGAEIAITKLVAGTPVSVTIESLSGIDYITSIKLTGQAGTTTPGATTTPGTTTTPNTTLPGTITTTATGTLISNVSNGVIRIVLTDGTSKVYLVSDTCSTTIDGVTVPSTSTLVAGDSATLTIENNVVTKIVAKTSTASGNTSTHTNTLASGEVTAKKYTNSGYIFTIKQGTTEQQITIPYTALITRNNRTVTVKDIKLGDKVQLTRNNGQITAVTATGNKSIVEGTLQSIYIATDSQIVVNINGQPVTYTLTTGTEVYDHNINEYISIRDLHIGQKVTVMLESMEVISIDVDQSTSSYNLIGTITNIASDDSYIDVLVDYDYETGASKVYKRVQLSSETPVLMDGKTRYVSSLEEDMEIVITYKYLDDKEPEKILVI